MQDKEVQCQNPVLPECRSHVAPKGNSDNLAMVISHTCERPIEGFHNYILFLVPEDLLGNYFREGNFIFYHSVRAALVVLVEYPIQISSQNQKNGVEFAPSSFCILSYATRPASVYVRTPSASVLLNNLAICLVAWRGILACRSFFQKETCAAPFFHLHHQVTLHLVRTSA